MVLDLIDTSKQNYQFRVQRMRGFFDGLKINNFLYPVCFFVLAFKKRSFKEAFKLTHKNHRRILTLGLISSFSY